MEELALFSVLILAFGLVSRRVERSMFSAPIFFVLAGVILFLAGLSVAQIDVTIKTVLLLGEVTLTLVLFSDASRISLSALRGNSQLPGRLLGIGLPLTILAGTIVGAILFTGMPFWEAAILSVVLAPTDASLGIAVVNDPRVPMRIRQALNVESGLNDGISVPFLMLFIALAEVETEATTGSGYWLWFAVREIGFGVLAGILVGLVGTWLIRQATLRRWMSDAFQRLSMLALALISYQLAAKFGGSGFIAAFVAGLTAGVILKKSEENLVEFAEIEGQLLNLIMFFILGGFAGRFLPDFTWQVLLYAVLSLTIVRILPVAISLIGTRLHRNTVLFMGWFGPRGLASIVMGLVFLEESTSIPNEQVITLTVVATVVLSVFAHGISSMPLIGRYQKLVQVLPAEAPENQEVIELPSRANL
jgi:NhaP-type Na+/H+ or K+/H+ antiporter